MAFAWVSKPAWASQVAQWYRVRLSIQEMQETQVQSLGREDPLDQEMANPLCYSWLGNPMDRKLVGYSPGGCKELDAT